MEEDLFNKTIFITGIAGFTGKHLESFYRNMGWRVYGSTYTKSNNSNHFQCDIRDSEKLREILFKIKPDYIIHTAAISFVESTNKNSMYDINVFGTLNLLEQIVDIEICPQKIIIASSASVYGNIGEELSEEMCPAPVNHYGNSKLAMENMTKNFFPKLNILITRPFNYTGVGQHENFLIPKIVKHYKDDKDIIELGNINVYREFNDVSYLVNCYYKLLVSDCSSEILNICSGKTFRIKDILSNMEEISGRKINLRINPKFVRKNEIKTLKGSTKKLHSVIDNFSDQYILKETLKKMYFHV